MTPQDNILSQLDSGALNKEEAAELLAHMEQDSEFAYAVYEDLTMSEYLAFELDPERSDDAFMAQLNAKIASIGIADTDTDTAKKIIEMPSGRNAKNRFPLFMKIAAIFVLMAALAAVLMTNFGAPDIATIADAGDGFNVQRGSKTLAATSGFELKKGDLIVGSSLEETLLISYGDRTSVEIIGDATLSLSTTDAGGKLISLKQGLATFNVSKQRSPLVVSTAHGDVTVVGTAFDVIASDKVITTVHS